MDNNILSALEFLNVADLTRAEWIEVGMALKEEGFPCSVWDDWSRNDTRYISGECEKKWNGFHGSSTPVKGGTIVQMAKDRGWTPGYFYGEEGCMNWDDAIEDDGIEGYMDSEKWDQVGELITYLETLFEPNDLVGYVTNEAWQDKNGKWVPSRGVFDRTAEELIDSLKKHPNDIGATVGDWKPEAGAWIRFNPVDGKGVRDENVTAFRYALVESDELPVNDQAAIYRALELPIACLVYSGGKSLHAIVHVDAPNKVEYDKRVDFLYTFLDNHGLPVDKQNKNPSRLSRMPGVTRNGNRQYLVDTNLGRKSWNEWMDFVEGVSDELPDIISVTEIKKNRPVVPEELIKGVLRRGHKMLISGSSKAGKSFLLMELCVAISEGLPWLGFECKQGKVLYVNLEIDPASCGERVLKIYEAMGIEGKNSDNLCIWNLRGHALPLDKLVPKLIRRIRDQHFDAVVIDPIYKVITGDENKASDMGAFCNQFDKICNETGCSTIYCHHHSKGAQGAKKAMDRASGSGVFARDPDALLDMIELELTDDLKNKVCDNGATAWRLESSLREFPNIKPVNIWFEYPVHLVDESGELEKAYADGEMVSTSINNLAKSGQKNPQKADIETEIDNAYESCKAFEGTPIVPLKSMAEYLGLTVKAVRNRIQKMPDSYYVKNGLVFVSEEESTQD